jgi:hypothetical protein
MSHAEHPEILLFERTGAMCVAGERLVNAHSTSINGSLIPRSACQLDCYELTALACEARSIALRPSAKLPRQCEWRTKTLLPAACPVATTFARQRFHRATWQSICRARAKRKSAPLNLMF